MTTIYYITIENAPGEARFEYDLNGVLTVFESSLGLKEEQARKLLWRACTLELMKEYAKWDGRDHRIRVTFERVKPTFERFWEAYGKKRDKLRVIAKWDKLSAMDRAMAMNALAKYKHRTKKDGIALKDPVNYLTQRVWEDFN